MYFQYMVYPYFTNMIEYIYIIITIMPLQIIMHILRGVKKMGDTSVQCTYIKHLFHFHFNIFLVLIITIMGG